MSWRASRSSSCASATPTRKTDHARSRGRLARSDCPCPFRSGGPARRRSGLRRRPHGTRSHRSAEYRTHAVRHRTRCHHQYRRLHGRRWSRTRAADRHRRNSVGAAALAAPGGAHRRPDHPSFDGLRFRRPQDGALLRERHNRPINAYGHSKSAGEAAVIRANPRHIILRTGWIFSPFGRNFVTGILARSTSEKRAWSSTTRRRGSPGYAPHLASAILDIAARITAARTTPVSDDDIWGIYHIANRGTPTWCDLARAALGEITHEGNASPRVTPAAAAAAVASTDQARRPLNATLDCSKLENTFELDPADWQEAVADCMRRLTTEAG